MGADEARVRIEQIVARIQEEILESSRRLAEAFSREAERAIPATGEDLTKLIDEAFEFAQQVMESQRRMVNEVLSNMDGALDRAPGQIEAAAKKLSAEGQRAVAKVKPATAAAKKATAKKAPAKKKATAKKAPAKKAPAKKAPTTRAGGR